MRKFLLLFIGIIFAVFGYYFGFNENLKWATVFLYLVASLCFVIQATLMIKKESDNNDKD